LITAFFAGALKKDENDEKDQSQRILESDLSTTRALVGIISHEVKM